MQGWYVVFKHKQQTCSSSNNNNNIILIVVVDLTVGCEGILFDIISVFKWA